MSSVNYPFENVESDGMLPAVFLGWRGEKPGVVVFMAGVHGAYICLDTDGNIMPTVDAQGNRVNPKTQPNFGKIVMYGMLQGEVTLLPATLRASMRNAVKSEQFAKIEFLSEIQDLFAQGKTGAEVHEFVKSQGGLIADPVEYATWEANNPGPEETVAVATAAQPSPAQGG